MRNDQIIINTIDYFLNQYINRDDPRVIREVSSDTYRIVTRPHCPSTLNEAWSNADVRVGANCLSFAANEPQFGYAHPDMNHPAFVSYLREGGRHDSVQTHLAKAFAVSGFERIAEHGARHDNTHIIAIAALPSDHEVDFHCYRLTRDGWLHKPGNKPFTNLDGSGTIITSPAECDRVEYKNFMGYYTIPAKGAHVTITPSALTRHIMS